MTETLTARALSLITDDALLLTGLAVAGMCVGMGITKGYTVWAEAFNRKPTKPMMMFIGMASTSFWTLFVEVMWMVAFMKVPFFLALFVGSGFAIVAGACNHPAYRAMKKRWALYNARTNKQLEKELTPEQLEQADVTGYKQTPINPKDPPVPPES